MSQCKTEASLWQIIINEIIKESSKIVYVVEKKKSLILNGDYAAYLRIMQKYAFLATLYHRSQIENMSLNKMSLHGSRILCGKNAESLKICRNVQI